MRENLQVAIAVIALLASIVFAFATVMCAAGSDGPKQRKASISWAALFWASYLILLAIVLRA